MKKMQSLTETPKTIFDERDDSIEEIVAGELGEKYIDYRKKWIKAVKRELVTDFPLYIQIEHSGKCNLRCPFCVHGIERLRENYSRGFKPLSIPIYKEILSEAKQYNCPSISFHNNDEPLLLNDLESRIQLAKEAGFLDIILVTNATLLTPKRSNELLKLGITKMKFSVDTWNEKEYGKIRRGGDFKTVLRNIDYFVEEKKRMGLHLPTTRATCVLTNHTYNEMDAFRQFWMEKVDIVEFQNFRVIHGYNEEFVPPGGKVIENFTCNSPWLQLLIRANGDVLPCCSSYGIDMVIGNIKNSTLYDIWNSDKMKNMRKELLKNNFKFSPSCEACSKCVYTF